MVSVELDEWMDGTVFGLRWGEGGGGEMKLLRLVGWFDMRDEMR